MESLKNFYILAKVNQSLTIFNKSWSKFNEDWQNLNKWEYI